MKPFRYYFRVRYSECDSQKVVFNARYGEYVDLAVTEYVRALGLNLNGMFEEFDFQLVKQTTEWKAPIRFDQAVEVTVTTKHVGNTSFTLLGEFRIAGSEPVTTTIETVYVNVDPKTISKMPLSDRIRQALERGAPGKSVDQADLSRK